MYKFLNFPKSIPIEEYENQTKEFLNDLNNLFVNEKFSLYSIWELWLPWVSDLDFLIISQDFLFKKNILDIIKKYNLIDTPIFLEYSKIDNIEYLTHHYNFNYVWGYKIDEKLLIKNNKNLFLIYSWKVLFFSWLRNFYIPFFKKEINVKKTLSWINDLRYPIYYLSKITNLDKEILDFINEYENFRKNWFNNPDEKKLVIFLEKSIKYTWDLIFIFSKEMFVITSIDTSIYWRFPTIFKNNNNQEFFIKKTEQYFKKISKIDRFLVLPISMNYKLWDDKIKKDLNIILSMNKNFLNFWFIWIKLNILLLLKKIIDFIKIKLFEKYEKI